MLHVNGHDVDFDVTAPADIQRYLAACDALDAAAHEAPAAPDSRNIGTREGLSAFEQYLTGQCRLLTDFIDGAFGDGTCNALLGKKTSLDGLLDVCDALRCAVTAQSEAVGAKLSAYKPNRATGRPRQ